MKKTIIALAAALALSVAAVPSAQALNIITLNSSDDGFYQIFSTMLANFAVQINQVAYVDEDISNDATSGDNDVDAGEDVDNLLIDTGDAEATSSLLTSVNGSDVTYVGLTAGASAEISKNSGDDPFYQVDEESTTNEFVGVDSFHDVDTDIDQDVESGDNDVDCGDDCVDIVLKSGNSLSELIRGFEVGFAKVTRLAP